ncbi:hypothetical protein [uncultured Shimia sp.]|uniref:hypothetical protein n=1 Tax=uncultured Shimia sp. TaxID=573152 RepID=UPI00260476EC|nr:hypothetical protein [uncultured Shimia sp.]
MTNCRIAALLLSAALIPATHVSAQSLPAPGQTQSDEWRHGAAIYLFAPVSTTGTSTIGGNSGDFDMDLGDILDVLDFAAAGRYEAWKGNWGVIFDANYAGISDKSPLGVGNVEITSRQKWAALLGAYRVSHGTTANGKPFAIDVQGGLRWNSIKQTIQTVGPTFGGDEDWIEPVIGIRGMWRLNDRWSTMASADAGGFGAGGNDLQYSVNLGFDYQPWDNTALTFGYRYFSVDYSTDGGNFAYETIQHGPYFGVKFFF